MDIIKMYPPQKDSPSTYLTGDIGTDDIYVMVGNAEVFETLEVPFPLTLGFDRSFTETVIVMDLGNGNNQLTVERGDKPLIWAAGTKCARVWTSEDVTAIQKNIATVADQTATNTSDIAANADESANAIQEETERATTAENELDANKVNRSELTVLITDVQYVADSTTVSVTFKTYDANAKEVGSFVRYLPIASNDAMGLMTPEAYAELIQLRSDVQSIMQQGGHFIGTSFATYADLEAYKIPSSVNTGDFTYVLDDEGYSDATTRYIYDGTSFNYAYTISFDPVGIATTDTAGLVKSDPGTNGGKIFVELDGTMSVVGWNSVLQSIANNISANNALITFQLNGANVDSITLNQSENKTINFDTTGGTFAVLMAFYESMVSEGIAYLDINDSTNDYILDSSGNRIRSQLIFVTK